MPQKRRGNGEGTVSQRKDGRWMAQYTDNTGKRRTIYGKKRMEVQIKLKEAIIQSDSGVKTDRKKLKFADWMAEWLETYKEPNVKIATYSAMYSLVHNHVIPAFPTVLLKDIDGAMLQKFFNELAVTGRLDGKPGGLGILVRRRIKSLIVSALNRAIDDRLIFHNPAKKILYRHKDATKSKY